MDLECRADAAVGPPASGPARPVATLARFAHQPLAVEDVRSVRGARVIWMDRAALADDYSDVVPGLRTPQKMSPADTQALANWLVRNGAIMSLAQTGQNRVNDPIPVSGAPITSYRPPRYGRAAIVRPDHPEARGASARPIPFFDIKGCGVPNDEEPVLPNSNGLLTLGEAVFEIMMQKIVACILRHARFPAVVVPAYALLDLGFFARFHGYRRDGKATVLLRRTLTRPAWQWGTDDPGRGRAARLLDFECLLRRHGVSASNCGAVRFRLERKSGSLHLTRDDEPVRIDKARLQSLATMAELEASAGRHVAVFDGVNVQVADGLDEVDPYFAVMDFGRYRFADSFDQILYSWSRRDYLALDGVFACPAGMCGPEGRLYDQPLAGSSLAGLPDLPVYHAVWDCVEQYEAGSGSAAAIATAIDKVEETAERLLACRSS